MRSGIRIAFVVALLAATISGEAIGAAATGDESPDGVWTLVEEGALESAAPAKATRWIRPARFQAVRLEPAALDAALARTPMELTPEADVAPTVLTIPTPEGGFERFAVVESPVMHPKLRQWLTDEGWPMTTYKGLSLDHPATTVRLDWGGPAGFHATVLSSGRTYYVDSYWQGETRLYASYFKRDYRHESKSFACRVNEPPGSGGAAKAGPGALRHAPAKAGGLLRTYRLAVAATGEYTTFHGGTRAAGLAAIVTTFNRVNQIYERDLSLRMVLVEGNQNLVFTDPATDPYTNDDAGALLSENQAVIDGVIGDAGYDIGHVLSTVDTGLAQLGASCQSGVKARGETGSSAPIGDPFDVDYVAHEIGHQWGGSHTFNSPLGGCGGNRAESAAFEPGSGSTIQAYAGLCGDDNLQDHSDDYFHGYSLFEIEEYIAFDGFCSVDVPTANAHAPTVDVDAIYVIPANTPFELTATGSEDLDGDALTYTWEEMDLGPPATLVEGDNGLSPLYRSWPPSPESTRVFPTDLIFGPGGEPLPTTDRVMEFSVTVRDNHPEGGRFGQGWAEVAISTAAGAFEVISPNGGERWKTGSRTVTWNVAGTGPGTEVDTAGVDILLSLDGGSTWPFTLAAGAPNDGSQEVRIPDVATRTARIKIKGAGNVFFDVSDDDFFINEIFYCNHPDLALKDPGTVFDDRLIFSSRSILDLDLTSLAVTHSYVGDLRLTLEHVETGTRVAVIDRPGYPAWANGCSGQNIEADLDDEAVLPVEDQCGSGSVAIKGRFKPNHPLRSFDGELLSGTWRLWVDDLAPEDTGSLNKWCLSFLTGEPPLFADGFESGDTSAWSSP